MIFKRFLEPNLVEDLGKYFSKVFQFRYYLQTL